MCPNLPGVQSFMSLRRCNGLMATLPLNRLQKHLEVSSAYVVCLYFCYHYLTTVTKEANSVDQNQNASVELGVTGRQAPCKEDK